MKFSIIIPTFNRLALLQQCVESLLQLDTNPDEYEIIVVNDGSRDGTSNWLNSAPHNGRIRFVEMHNGGPTRARNKGVAIANGDILVFTDDDCTHPATWLRDLERRLTTQQAVAVGGAVHNQIENNNLTLVYEKTNILLAQRFNEEEGKARFLTTNNFAILRTAFDRYGNFDERFFTGAEDRELVARLIAAGERVIYAPDICINHFHDFTLREFLFLLYRQGRGSYLYYNVMGKEKNLGLKPLSFLEYLTLMNTVSQDASFIKRVMKWTLAVLAQVSVLLGYISATWEGVTDLTTEHSEHTRSAASGERGTMFGLLSFLGGTVFSSAFGFFSFVIIGRTLSIPDFGIFMVAFSLESLLGNVVNLGLPQSVVRFASEFSKHGNEADTNSVIKTGFVLQGMFVLVFGTAGFFLADTLMNNMMKVALPAPLFIAVLTGAMGSVFYNYASTIYSIHLRFIDLTVLRSIVSIVRFASILTLSLLSLGTPVNLFWAFIIPYWLGLVISLAVMLKSIQGKGSVRKDYFRRILAYGGWNTASNMSRLLTTHFGALILAAYTSEQEVGTYGLGQTLSFVYAVISMTVSQYFMPIGARVKSNDDIIPFVRRTLRLAMPLVVVSLFSLLFAYPVMSLMYGESRTVAVPVFVFISLSILTGTSFVSVNVLFHYFFKPYFIALETVLRAILFLSGSLLFAPSTGAAGVAGIYLASNILAQGVSFVLLAREFKRRGISLEPRMWKTFGFSDRKPHGKSE